MQKTCLKHWLHQSSANITPESLPLLLKMLLGLNFSVFYWKREWFLYEETETWVCHVPLTSQSLASGFEVGVETQHSWLLPKQNFYLRGWKFCRWVGKNSTMLSGYLYFKIGAPPKQGVISTHYLKPSKVNVIMSLYHECILEKIGAHIFRQHLFWIHQQGDGSVCIAQ